MSIKGKQDSGTDSVDDSASDGAAVSADDATETSSAPSKSGKLSLKNRDNTPKNRSSFEDRMKRASKGIATKSEAEALDAHADDSADGLEATNEAEKPSPAGDGIQVQTGTIESRMEEAAKALEAGDLKALAKALGKDAKLVDASSEKFSVLRRKATKLEGIETKLRAENDRIIGLGRTLNEEFGQPKAIKAAYKAGKFSAAAAALNKWLGDDFGTITRNIAREVAGLSPEEKKQLEEKAKFEQEKAEWEAERAKSKKVETEAQKMTRALETVKVKCTGHAVLKLKDGAKLVLDEMVAAYDQDQGGSRISFKQAADAVMERKLEDARALGFTTVAAAEASGAMPKTPAPAPQNKRLGTNRPQDPSASASVKRRSFEERQEAARRITAKSRRV